MRKELAHRSNETLLTELREIYQIAGWHSDDNADPADKSPPDAVAHANGLIRWILREAILREFGCSP